VSEGVRVVGADAVIERLERLIQRVASGRVWESALKPGMENLRLFAVSISPEVTGAYKRAHTVDIDGMAGILSNSIPYAVNVEEIHSVYSRTAEGSGDIITETVRDLLREIVK
jgi:hypothetical protein